MRILQIINSADARRGGAEKLCNRLKSGLQANNIQSEILSLEALPEVEQPGVHTLAGRSVYSPTTFFRLLFWLYKHRQKYDLVQVHLFPAILYVALIKWSGLVRLPLVFTEHNSNNRRRDNRLGRAIDRAIYKQIDLVICISEGVLKSLCSHLPNLRSKSIVVHNGIQLKFASMAARTEKPTFDIVSVGRLHIQKNYQTALKAIAKVQFAPIRYTIYGDGDERSNLKALISELNLTNTVMLAGYSDNIPSVLQNADIFIMPSRWEGFGLAAVEAMNAGLPGVYSNVPGLREIVGKDKASGFLVPPDSSECIAAAVERLVEDASLRRRMGEQAFRNSLKFDERDMFSKYADVFKGLVVSPGNSAQN